MEGGSRYPPTSLYAILVLMLFMFTREVVSISISIMQSLNTFNILFQLILSRLMISER